MLLVTLTNYGRLNELGRPSLSISENNDEQSDFPLSRALQIVS